MSYVECLILLTLRHIFVDVLVPKTAVPPAAAARISA
jgi:hypothetical protein